MTDDRHVVTILHFNDVYNVEERSVEPVGGAARFVGVLGRLRDSLESPVVFFSGDVLAPSSSERASPSAREGCASIEAMCTQ